MPTPPLPPQPVPAPGSGGSVPAPGGNYVLQSRADYSDEELAAQGGNFAVARIVQGGRDRLALVADHAAQLARAGIDQPWLDAMNAELQLLSDSKGDRDNTTSARKDGSHAEDAALDDLADWVHGYERAVKLAPRAIKEKASALPHHWADATHIAAAIPGVQKFLRANAFTVRGVSSSQYADQGDAKLAAFTAGRNVHVQAGGQLSPAALAMRVHVGVVGLELERLFHAAEDNLSHTDAHRFSVAPLRNGRGGKAHKPAAPNEVKK